RARAPQHPALPRRADRIRLRSHGNPVRHRRAGCRNGARVRRDASTDGITEHFADLHRGSRRHRPPAAMILDVAVVGGGIAGLAAAYELKSRGVTFAVIERTERAGGVILSEQVDGFTIDAGPDALLTQKRDAIALCEELGLGSRLTPTLPPRVAYIQRDNRLHALPAGSVLGIPTRLGPFVRTSLFSWRADRKSTR